MRCSSCEPLLDAYLEGSLSARDSRGVGAHVRACEQCAALLRELRIVDALLTTARPPGVAPGFTAAVVSATPSAPPQLPRRAPLGFALLLYLGAAWALAIILAWRSSDVLRFTGSLAALGWRDVVAIGIAARALAPATPAVAAAVTVVLLVDLLLLWAVFFGYRRLRPLLATYLERGSRS